MAEVFSLLEKDIDMGRHRRGMSIVTKAVVVFVGFLIFAALLATYMF